MSNNEFLTEGFCKTLIEIENAGLTSGKGNPKPGEMCVQAAVCYAMGLPHSDQPPCVIPIVRSILISLNDSGWSSKEARVKGLKRLSIAQLGTAGTLNEQEFKLRLDQLRKNKFVPEALEAAASVHPKKEHQEKLRQVAKELKEGSGTLSAAAYAASSAANAAYAYAAYAYAASSAAYDAAYAASSAASAANAANAANAAKKKVYDSKLSEYAEDIVQILVAMDTPGSQFLYLTEESQTKESLMDSVVWNYIENTQEETDCVGCN